MLLHAVAFIVDGKTVTTTRRVETVTKVGGASGRPAGTWVSVILPHSVALTEVIVHLYGSFTF